MCLAPVDVVSTQVPMSIPVVCMELTSITSHTNVGVCLSLFICIVYVRIYIYIYICICIYINVCTHCTPRHLGCRCALYTMCLHIVGWRSAYLLNHTNAQIHEHSRRGSRARGAVLVHMGRNLIQPGCCRLPLSLMSACAGLPASQHWRGTCADFTYSCGLAHVP